MEELFAKFLAPLLLSAVAVGGIVYPFRFWGKDWKQFWQLIAATVLGILVGYNTDPSFSGARTGAAVGAIALPLIGWMRRRFRTNVVRTELHEHGVEGASLEDDRDENEDEPETRT